MKIIFASLTGFVLLFGCSKPHKAEVPMRTGAQREIVNGYNRLDSISKLPSDSVQAYADHLVEISKGQPPEYRAMAGYLLGVAYAGSSRYELAFKTFENNLRLLRKSKQDTLRARSLSGIGNYYRNTGDYPKALQYQLHALKIYEMRQNRRGIASSYVNIGQVYMQKNDLASAKDYLKRAMAMYDQERSQNLWLSAAHSLANVYGMNDELEAALALDNAALRITDSIGSDRAKVPFLDNKANCYLFSGKLDSAEYYFRECLRIDKVVGDQKQVADSYTNLGYLELFKGNFGKAEEYTLQSLEMLKTIDNKHNILKAYEVLGDIYERSGQYGKALKANESFLAQYQELMDERKEASVAEFRIVHETEKKEKIIAQNRLQLLEKEREVESRNNLLILVSLFAAFIALTGFLIYRQQKLRNRQQEQEHQLKTAIAQIETQNKLQEQRLQISRDLHDNIGAQLTFVISSVDNLRYAFDIKDTKLERKLDSISRFTQSTIVELRDTIWAMNHAQISLEDLRVRIFNFVEKAKDASGGIDFRFHIDEDLAPIRFSSVAGMNLYRSIQEAVNNAVKYSQASRIGIFIERQGNGLQVRIEDNGRGFSPDTVAKGNGLLNIQKRVADLGGSFEIRSSPDSGAHITIVLPQV